MILISFAVVLGPHQQQSGVTAGFELRGYYWKAQGTIRNFGDQPKSATCKAKTLPSLMLLHPLF